MIHYIGTTVTYCSHAINKDVPTSIYCALFFCLLLQADDDVMINNYLKISNIMTGKRYNI